MDPYSKVRWTNLCVLLKFYEEIIYDDSMISDFEREYTYHFWLGSSSEII